ncbi:MAG TPA: adenylate/guanylate cyclase domain-containing protein [Candidatus Saccharimonadales bacterium]|nr:adenylate/guanylate cyclase domain-containing protein [Candidatus Saccharimonadales bacterium]
MICSNCGTQNPPGAKFCTECASRLAIVCAACGTANSATAKFCAECAAPLAGGAAPAASRLAAIAQPPAPLAERRLVSILFADLVGFTTLAEGRDAEETRDLLSRYFDLSRDVIGRYGGTIEKFIGDAVMAVWGAPVAREDDAERAVRAGIELVASVTALGPSVHARAGVLTGQAAVTLGATNQGMVAGDLVNTASRLQSVAPSGTVLVGEATMRAASRAIVFEEAGEHLLKGKASPVPAWRALRVVAERGGRNRAETLEAPFVGRDDELRLLKDLFHATGREGRSRLVSVIGPAGIGKSRLAWEFLKYVDGLVERVWWHDGRSPAYGEGITFWALGEMIRGRARLQETDDEPTTRAGIAAMLRDHVPDEAERVWIEPALLSLLGIESGGGSQQLFGAWRTFFERLAASGQVVMIFEDLHHADAGLLDFIDHLLEWSRNVPILIVTLARPELLERRADWGAGKRSFTSIYLEPLPTQAMRQLLDGLVPGLPGAARDAIVRRADGIPLYAVETVRMLMAQGRLVLEDSVYRPVDDLSDLAVPETLTALISARLDELDAADRALVADAAVLGQSFTMAGVAAVSGLDPAAIEPRLRAFVRRELLVQQADPRSPERGQYAFVQALIREVAYNTLAKRDRKVRHLAAARFLESLETDELAGALANHYLAAHGYASDGPEADALAAQARVALRGAADRAAALGSHAQAITLLEHAVGVSPDPADQADLHERALASAQRGLVAEIAQRHALDALEARRELGDREGIAVATAAYARAVGGFGVGDGRTLEILLPAWEEFSDLEETPAGVAMMLEISRGYAGAGDDHATIAWIERLLPVAERLDLLERTATGLSRLSTALFRLDRPREALILLRGAHELAVANDLEEVHRATRTVLTFYEQFADPGAGLAMAREGLEIARRRGSAAYGFVMVGNAVSCAIRVGEWAWASALLDEWLANEITGEFYLELYVDRAVLTALRGADASGDLAEAERLLPGMKDPQYTSYCHWGRAWAAFTAGRLTDARQEAVLAGQATNYFVPITLPLAARAALWAADAPHAREIVGQIESSVIRGQAVALDLVTLRAGIAALEGRRSEAISGYRDALRGWRNLGLVFDEAMAALDMAMLLTPTEREMAEAPAAVEASRETLTRLGASPFLARLEAVLAGIATELPLSPIAQVGGPGAVGNS